MKFNESIIEKLLLIAVAIILMAVGSFLDLNISVLFVDYNTIIGRIVENHILLLVFVPVLYAIFALWKINQNNLLLLGALALSLYAGFENMGKYTTGFLNIFMSIVFTALLFGLVFVSVYVRKVETLKLNQVLYKRVILIFLTTVIVVHAIKFFNGRVRFRNFKDVIAYSEYTPWYQFVFLGKGDSFPSGHTSTLYVLLPILAIYKKDTRINRYISYGLVLLTAFMRIRIGAHFLTDTMIGLIIAIICDLFVSYYGAMYFENKTNRI